MNPTQKQFSLTGVSLNKANAYQLLITRPIILFIALLMPTMTPLVARAEDELPDAKAATEIIEGLQSTLGDLSTILALPPQQRVDWVLKQAADRVQNKIIDNAKDQIKEAMSDYAKAAFRAQAFKTIAIPSIKNSMALKTFVNWELLESQMASDVNTKTVAYGAVAAGATIVWDAVDAFSTVGAQAGFSKMAADLYQAVADSYIPGWGWFKLGVTMVEGLGNYILSYATDTATEGMLNDLFNMRGDPKSFAQMLRITQLSDIYKKVDDGWELVAYGRLWNGQGTDAGDVAMKQRLKDALYNLKAGVAHEYAEQMKKDAELMAKFQPYLDTAAQAEAKLKVAATKVKSDAQPLLTSIRDFQRLSGQRWEDKSLKDAQTFNAQAVSAPNELPYAPIPRASFMSFYNTAYGRVKESTGGSFDDDAFRQELNEGNIARQNAVDSQPVPPDGPGKLEWLAHRDADRKAISSELHVIWSQADQRAAQMAQAISDETSMLAAQLNEQNEKLEQGLVALENEASENLLLPSTFQRYSFPSFTQSWLYNNGANGIDTFFTSRAENYKRIAPYQEKLEKDRETLQSLNSRRRTLYTNYTAFLAMVEDKMQSLIPQGAQVFTTTVADGERLRRTWSINYQYYTPTPLVFQSMPLSAVNLLPELTTSEFDSQEAIQSTTALLAELQNDYDTWLLQQALGKVAQMLDEKLQPFKVTNTVNPLSFKGRVNGLLDYRKSLEQTDLYSYIGKFEPVWLAAQTRIELLKRHPTLIDAAPYLKFGTNLTSYKSLLTSDQADRQRAPSQAESLQSSFQQAIDYWTPILVGMYPEYYEDALGGLGSTLANAQVAYMYARSASSPTYTLMQDYLRNYLPQVTNLLKQAQSEYALIAQWYGKTIPSLTPSSSSVNGSVGQAINLSFDTDGPGGTYSVFYLPAGLAFDPTTGTISGRVSQSGNFEVCVRYKSPFGVSNSTIVQLAVDPPTGAVQVLAINNGYPEIKFQGVEGSNYILQVRNELEGDDRWVTIKTLRSDQSWIDLDGLLNAKRFYRLVWAQP